MAYNEDIIRRNPFDFKLVDVVPNDSQKRIAMTEEQQELWMDFIREDKNYAKYYDEFVVLPGTRMRVSEFCGLTKSDLNFESRKIRVNHQEGMIKILFVCHLIKQENLVMNVAIIVGKTIFLDYHTYMLPAPFISNH